MLPRQLAAVAHRHRCRRSFAVAVRNRRRKPPGKPPPLMAPYLPPDHLMKRDPLISDTDTPTCTPTPPAATDHGEGTPAPVMLGDYRIAARPLPLAGGRFRAQVSIASGPDSDAPSHEMHFREEFPTRAAAAYFAMTQGLRWAFKTLRLGASHTPA